MAKVFEPLNIFHDKVRAVSKITDKTKKLEILLDKKANMPGEATLDRLLELSLNKTSEKDVTNILNILGKSFSDSKKDDRTYLTHEKTHLYGTVYF